MYLIILRRCYTKFMKKVILAVFAHPDDEAFGPAGTLLIETKSGTELHLVSLTAGEAGTNPDNHPNLGQVRLQEWQTAGKLIGATSMTCLNYADNQLNNQSMIEICDKLVEKASGLLKELPADGQLEIMSMDLNGITGHIDHIVASRASHCAFYKLQPIDSRLKQLRLVCIPKQIHPNQNTDWLFMEAGRCQTEIDQTIDARVHQAAILAIMRTHASQAADAERLIKQRGDSLGIDHFMVKT